MDRYVKLIQGLPRYLHICQIVLYTMIIQLFFFYIIWRPGRNIFLKIHFWKSWKVAEKKNNETVIPSHPLCHLFASRRLCSLKFTCCRCPEEGPRFQRSIPIFSYRSCRAILSRHETKRARFCNPFCSHLS